MPNCSTSWGKDDFAEKKIILDVITVNMKCSMKVSICKLSDKTMAHPNVFLAI
jgi:hypothetical protein